MFSVCVQAKGEFKRKNHNKKNVVNKLSEKRATLNDFECLTVIFSPFIRKK